MSVVCLFLILTIYPKGKAYHLHFTEGKTEVRESPYTVPSHLPPSTPFGPMLLPGQVAPLGFTPSLALQTSKDHKQGIWRKLSTSNEGGWPPPGQALRL